MFLLHSSNSLWPKTSKLPFQILLDLQVGGPVYWERTHIMGPTFVELQLINGPTSFRGSWPFSQSSQSIGNEFNFSVEGTQTQILKKIRSESEPVKWLCWTDSVLGSMFVEKSHEKTVSFKQRLIISNRYLQAKDEESLILSVESLFPVEVWIILMFKIWVELRASIFKSVSWFP